MGEAKRRARFLVSEQATPAAVADIEAKREERAAERQAAKARSAPRIPLYPDLRVTQSPADRMVLLFLGAPGHPPVAGTAMTPEDARKLAGALINHAAQVETSGRLVLTPDEARAQRGG